MNPDQRALLNCVIDYPDDDMPRLVYCDWLEEFGTAEDEAYAAFIRSQLKTPLSVELKFPWPGVSCFYNRGFISEVRCSMSDWVEYGPILCNEHPVSRIEINGIHAHTLQESDDTKAWRVCDYVLAWPASEDTRVRMVLSKRPDRFWKRGFYWKCHCNMADWLEFGPVLCSEHPIELVEISNKSPMLLPTSAYMCAYLWRGAELHDCQDPSVIPYVISGLRAMEMMRFNTMDKSKEWLSDCCVNWAKSQAPSFTSADSLGGATQ